MGIKKLVLSKEDMVRGYSKVAPEDLEKLKEKYAKPARLSNNARK